MDPRRTVSPETALASDIFDKFCSANTLKGILNHYRQLCSVLRTKPTHFPDFYPRLRAKLSSWRAQGLWSKFEKRASQKCYGRGKACFGTRVLIIGGGPCGLRTAIEAQLLGAKVVLVEKRDRFSRNNVLHLWPFVITDLKALGAKKFYGKFCAGSIDHISIRQLQCILLKVALLLGVEIHEGVGFEGLREPCENEGWRAVTSPADHPVSHYNFDVLIGADGRRNTLDGFKRKALRAKLAIAITANFINKHTEAEARVKEISGVSYIFNQKFFQDLCEATGIDLENIVYYKDETHYFVMTAKKQSLLNKGVLLQDYSDTAKLLSHENISTEALMVYALEAATFATDYQLPDIEFAVNHYGQPDVAMFDFTAMYAAENACRVVQKKNHKLLMTLVGDSLLEPFWPTGSGCARGFLSSFDACWMLRSWTGGIKSVLEVVAERESIYRLLGQTTPENLQKEHIAYSIDPHTRYPNLNLRLVMPFQVKSLYEADEKISDITDGVVDTIDEKTPKKRRRDSVIAIDSLLTWLRDQVSCYDLEVIDVREAFVRGDVLCAVIHRFRPDLIEYPLPSEENVDPLITAAYRNQLAFDILHQEYSLSHVMSGFDSVQFGTSDFLTLVAYLSQVYEIFRGEIPQTKYFRSESGDELEDNFKHSTDHMQALKELRMAVSAKHHISQKAGRKARLSSGSRDAVDGEHYRRHKKRRSDERSSRLGSSDVRATTSNSTTEEDRKFEDRVFDAERFLKSMRLLQLSQTYTRPDGQEYDLVEDFYNNDEDFEEYDFGQANRPTPIHDFKERRKALEQKLGGRETRTTFGKLGDSQSDSEKLVPGLAKDLEAKFKGRTVDKQKPKDLIRAIGKIEKSDWNVQLIEKKMAETKEHASGKKDRDNKVPRWSREAYDDKREAMKRKMDGGNGASQKDNVQIFDENLTKLGNKLKEGNSLDIGQRGSNKVSAMAEQLTHKLERPKQPETLMQKQMQPTRSTFELPKKGRIDLCHFCKERVYVVERMTAEGRFFHRNCFRCEYCNTSLRIGNYAFDREGRYGERFYCSPHYATVRMYGWKKFELGGRTEEEKYSTEGHNLLTPPSQQMLSEMDERGTTPERVEFENSVDFTSEEDLLNEMDEDEWTDRNNIGASNADNENTDDEVSELSDDEEVTPEGNNAAVVAKNEFHQLVAEEEKVVEQPVREIESSDSDTEVASDDAEDAEGSGQDGDKSLEDDEDEEEDEDEDDEDEEDEDECGGSTTEIETDSEFAEDPPNVPVPGSIPTIVVDAPEQLVTKLTDTGIINKPKHVNHHHHHQNHAGNKESKHNDHKGCQTHSKFKDLYIDKNIELVKKGAPERQLPVVTPVPRKWEPLSNNPDRLTSKVSLELKKKYLHGVNLPSTGINSKRPTDPAAQNQFRSVLDMISEQQKLLQPAAKPSATMQAFLDGAEKLKNKTGIVPMNRNLATLQSFNLNSEANEKQLNIENSDIHTLVVSPNNGNTVIQPTSPLSNTESTEKLNNPGIPPIFSGSGGDKFGDTVVKVISEENSSLKDEPSIQDMEFIVTIKSSDSKDIDSKGNSSVGILDSASMSNSETETRSTVINANDLRTMESPSSLPIQDQSGSDDDDDDEIESGSDTEVGSPFSDLDDLDYDIPPRVAPEPPRVEIEDEFGVTQSLEAAVVGDKSDLPIKKKTLQLDANLSSSDSSLNSGIFLETEMSDYVKVEDSAAVDNKHITRRGGKNRKGSRKSKNDINTDINAIAENNTGKTQSNTLSFDLEALDFADIDGGSSSAEDFLEDIPRKQNNGSFTALSSLPTTNNTIPFPKLDSDASYPPETFSGSSSLQSEDEVSSTSAKDVHEHSTETDLSDNYKIPVPGIKTSIQKTDKDVDQEIQLSLEKAGSFSRARDSLDYRQTKGISNQFKTNDLYSTYSVPSSKGVEPVPLQSSSRESNEIASTIIGVTSAVIIGEESSRFMGSPGTTRKLNEIHQERVKQNDLIRSMVLGRIKRSPEKGLRRNSKGSSSGTSPHSSDAAVEKSGDDTDSRISSDNSQYQDGNTSEDCDASKESGKPYSAASSSDISSGNDIPHRPMAESVTSHSDDSSSSNAYAKVLISPQNYEPVFVSSPRFRSRPKVVGDKLHFVNQSHSKTEPSTPASINPSLVEPHYPPMNVTDNDGTTIQVIHSVRNPLFYRSMPNLMNFAVNSVEVPQTNANVADAEEMLSSRPQVTIQHTNISQDSNFIEPKSEVYVTSPQSPQHKHNPFLARSSNVDEKSEIIIQSPHYDYPQVEENHGDDFINLHLRFRSKDQQPSDRRSAEKSRSMYADPNQGFSDSGYFQHSPPSSSMTQSHHEGQSTSGISSWDGGGGHSSNSSSRPRANTLADLHFQDSLSPGGSQKNISASFEASTPKEFMPTTRHSIDNSDASKPSKSKSKALSSDTLLDSSNLSDSACRGTSVPDISGSMKEVRMSKGKGRDRDRRKSLIQAVSDFFTSRSINSVSDKSPGTGQSASLTTSTSSSSIVSPSKDRFSLFKLTPKLLQNRDKKITSKTKGTTSPDQTHKGLISRVKTDFSAYSAQPELVIQRLSSSPSGTIKDKSQKDIEACEKNMANLSILNTGDSCKNLWNANHINRDPRAREMEEIQLQLESIEADQKSLESKGVKIEKRLRGEEQDDEENRADNEIMEEWFTLVKEKTKLARFEKELLVRAQELDIEMRREQLQQQLKEYISIPDKTHTEQQREADLRKELRRINDQHSTLVNSIHADMEKYNTVDPNKSLHHDYNLGSPIASRLESDV